MRSIDLNADVGESYGAWRMGQDEALLPLVSSANIACGFHAGDPGTMHATVRLALSHGVAIGAHPSLPDLAGFGRRAMQVSANEAYGLVLYQVGALSAFARAAGGELRHVKPHGALYNMAARDRALSDAIASAVHAFDPTLVLVGLAGSALVAAGRERGLDCAEEVFADRRYEDDGSLTPRTRDDALIHDEAEARAQVFGMLRDGEVASRSGRRVPLNADTVCLHGDAPRAVEFARTLRAALAEAGFEIRAPRHRASTRDPDAGRDGRAA